MAIRSQIAIVVKNFGFFGFFGFLQCFFDVFSNILWFFWFFWFFQWFFDHLLLRVLARRRIASKTPICANLFIFMYICVYSQIFVYICILMCNPGFQTDVFPSHITTETNNEQLPGAPGSSRELPVAPASSHQFPDAHSSSRHCQYSY